MASSSRFHWHRNSWSLPLAVALIGTYFPAATAQDVAMPVAPAPAVPAVTASFLALSDIHYTAQTGQTCGQSGYETDPTLWAAAQAEAQRVIQAEHPAFAIYLGDLPSHCDGHPLTEFTVALDGLAAIVGSGTKLIYVPGNNDSLDGDYYPFTSAGGTPLTMSTAWNGNPVLNAQPGDMIDATHLANGYYSAYAVQATTNGSALRVLALNTNMFTSRYDSQNGASYQSDTNAQLEWFNAQLKDVRAKHEKVIIAMHAPPGVDGFGGGTMWNRSLRYTGQDPDLTPGWVQATFLTIVAGYGPEIVGLLSSHTHYNEIRRLRDCSRKLPWLGAFTELDVAIPAITTDHGNNPSVKLFSYDDKFEWTENRTFYASNATGAGWDSNAPLSFDSVNYPCPSCAVGDTLFTRIAALDQGTQVNRSKPLAQLMIKWLKVGAPPPGRTANYMLALDVNCQPPQ